MSALAPAPRARSQSPGGDPPAPYPWAEALQPIQGITKLWVCKNPGAVFKRRADMMINIGIRQFQVKCGFGNAMVMELRDFENINEMLDMADVFMEQGVEPEGRAGALPRSCSATVLLPEHVLQVTSKSG
eukprot:SAG11_NODE_5091_length_1666_cov_4.223357_3_plen_130_part_00